MADECDGKARRPQDCVHIEHGNNHVPVCPGVIALAVVKRLPATVKDVFRGITRLAFFVSALSALRRCFLEFLESNWRVVHRTIDLSAGL